MATLLSEGLLEDVDAKSELLPVEFSPGQFHVSRDRQKEKPNLTQKQLNILIVAAAAGNKFAAEDAWEYVQKGRVSKDETNSS